MRAACAKVSLASLAFVSLMVPLGAHAQPSGPEFRVNAYTSGAQQFPQVAPISDIWWIVTWVTDKGQGGLQDIYAQRVDLNGGAYGSEFRVNTYTSGAQYAATVDADLAGNFVIVWGGGTSQRGVHGQRFSVTGALIGSEFRVNTDTFPFQSAASVAVPKESPTGFVVAWRDRNFPDYHIMGQRFQSSGAPAGAPFRVNTYTTAAFNPRVAASKNSFVVVWESSRDGAGLSVQGQLLDASANPIGGEFRVNQSTSGDQEEPTVAMRRDGSFFIVWRDDGADADFGGINGRFYDAAGVPGAVFRVNTTTTFGQDAPAVGVDLGGRFLVAWEGLDTGGSEAIFAQRFGPTGLPEATEFLASTYTTGNQLHPAVAGTSQYKFIVVWDDSHGQAGGVPDIYGQNLCLVGDANFDNAVNVSDVLYLINYLFAAGPDPRCADVNADGQVNVTDVLYLINHLFAGGPAPV